MNRIIWFFFALILCFLVVTPASAQLPLPYAFGGLSLNNGGGYQPLAAEGGAGLILNSAKLFADAEASIDNAHKQDSGTGHDLFFQARAFRYTSKGWYLGGGIQENKLETIDYSKEAWRPALGGGKDFLHEVFSLRAQALYVMPGTDHLNASQGSELTIWIPSPKTNAHWIYREVIGIYEFHQTSVPGDSGTENRYVTCFADFTMQYRF